MSNLEEMFSAMNTAKGSTGGTFFDEGVYLVELKDIEYRDGYKGKSCHFHFTVLESNNGVSPKSTRVWILKLDKSKDENERTMADIKGLIFALLGTSLKEVGSPEKNPGTHQQATAMFLAAIDETYAKKNSLDGKALIGERANLEVHKTLTKKGGEYSRHNFSPAPATAA